MEIFVLLPKVFVARRVCGFGLVPSLQMQRKRHGDM